jgi:hypothetical protein
MIKLVLFSLLNLLTLWLILHLPVTHVLLELNFPLVFLFFLFFAMVICLGLFNLQSVVLIFLLPFSLFFPLLLLQLLIELLFNLFLEFFLSQLLKFLFLFEELGVEFDKSCPLIIIVSLNLIYWFWTNRAELNSHYLVSDDWPDLKDCF